MHGQTYGNEWVDYSQQYFQFALTPNDFSKIRYQPQPDQKSISGQDISLVSRRHLYKFVFASQLW